jgi:hypothetical protein
MADAKRLAHVTEQDDIDEQELKRLYYERLSVWSDPWAIRVMREGDNPAILATTAGDVLGRRPGGVICKRVPEGCRV